PRVEEPVQSEPEQRAEDELRAGREERGDRHVEAQRDAHLRIDRDAQRAGERQADSPRSPVPGVHLEARIPAHEERDAAGTHGDAAQWHAEPEPEVRVGRALERVEHVEAHSRVGGVREPVRPTQARRWPAHLAVERILPRWKRFSAVEAPPVRGRGGEQGQERQHGYSRYARSIWVTKANSPRRPSGRRWRRSRG